MIVEDDPEVLELAADILREGGHRVIEALGADEALSLVASGETPELVVTDVVMPRLTGPQLVAKLREALPDVSVLYMSGYASDRRTDIAIDADSLLRKPFTHRELRQRVERLLSRAEPGQGRQPDG